MSCFEKYARESLKGGRGRTRGAKRAKEIREESGSGEETRKIEKERFRTCQRRRASSMNERERIKIEGARKELGD